VATIVTSEVAELQNSPFMTAVIRQAQIEVKGALAQGGHRQEASSEPDLDDLVRQF
jgi:hypothetical protein